MQVNQLSLRLCSPLNDNTVDPYDVLADSIPCSTTTWHSRMLRLSVPMLWVIRTKRVLTAEAIDQSGWRVCPTSPERGDEETGGP